MLHDVRPQPRELTCERARTPERRVRPPRRETQSSAEVLTVSRRAKASSRPQSAPRAVLLWWGPVPPRSPRRVWAVAPRKPGQQAPSTRDTGEREAPAGSLARAPSASLVRRAAGGKVRALRGVCTDSQREPRLRGCSSLLPVSVLALMAATRCESRPFRTRLSVALLPFLESLWFGF